MDVPKKTVIQLDAAEETKKVGKFGARETTPGAAENAMMDAFHLEQESLLKMGKQFLWLISGLEIKYKQVKCVRPSH